MPSLWYFKIKPSIFAMMRSKNLIISLVDGRLLVYDMSYSQEKIHQKSGGSFDNFVSSVKRTAVMKLVFTL
jgi:hypothetical protein